MFHLLDVLGPARPTIDIVDVGAMWTGLQSLPYRAIVQKGAARVVAFEPVREECDRVNAQGLPGLTCLPYCIGDGTERTFHLTNTVMTSSLYPPNTPLLERFQALPELTVPVRTQRVQTRRLDDLPEVAAIDLLKADVQGAELDVLRGSTRLLRSAVVVHAEVCFVPLYLGQPLFADVDAFLRELGFLLHTFAGMSGRVFRPLRKPEDPHGAVRQILWSDVVYVRDFTRFEDLTAEQLLKLAVIVHEMYGSYDLASLALSHHDRKASGALWPDYMKRLTGEPPKQPPPL